MQIINFCKLYKQVETQTTNQRQCDHDLWPEANVGQQYRKGQDRFEKDRTGQLTK